MLGTGGSFGYNTRVQSILSGTSRQDLEVAGHVHCQEHSLAYVQPTFSPVIVQDSNSGSDAIHTGWPSHFRTQVMTSSCH